MLEWLTLASAELGGSRISDEQLSKLNDALVSRTFLAGGSGPSLADVVYFGLLHSAVVSTQCWLEALSSGSRKLVKAWVNGVEISAQL